MTDTGDERDAGPDTAADPPSADFSRHSAGFAEQPQSSPSERPMSSPRIGCAVARLDLGAFVLGALDEGEAQQVRAHVATCPRCRAEYDELAGLPGFLARLTEPEARASGVAAAGVAPARLLAAAAVSRDRRRRMRLVSAAAAAVFVVLAGALGWSLGDSSGTDRAGAPAPSSTSAPTPPPEPPAGRTVRASDPRSGVGAELRYSASAWGSNVDLTVSGINPGTRCQLDVYGGKGRVETASSWVVPPAGYESGERMRGTTGIPVDEITRFAVNTVGDGTQLLEIRPTQP